MFDKVNLEEELKTLRKRENAKSEAVLASFKHLFKAEWEYDQEILSRLNQGALNSNLIEPRKLDQSRIYSLKEIKRLCIEYRLRFLSTKYFKKNFPADALAEIKKTEEIAGDKIEAFAMIAPSAMFKLEDSNKDPLLFAPLSDGRFYLIHKWGSDLSSSRKILAWPSKTLVNLLISISVLSLFLAAIIPNEWLVNTENASYFNFYRIAFVGFNAIFFSGVISYFWLVLNQKFSVEAWNSSTFN